MAPVEIYTPASYIPIGALATHILLIGYLSYVVGRTIYRSYVALPPSSATRDRQQARKNHILGFSGLAALSLLVAAVLGAQISSTSYRNWASERGVDLPSTFFGDKGGLRGGEHPGRLHIVRWLHDTSFYRETQELIADVYRYSWWGQQVSTGLVSWSMYLSIEGQRRKISNLWAFLALAQLVNLSYAQNLFFLIVLLTPVPLPSNVRDITRSSMPVTSSRLAQLREKFIPAKPAGFVPKPTVYITLLLASFTTVFLVPVATYTPSFANIEFLSRALPFTFLAAPYIIPNSWGTTHIHPHDDHSTYTTIFQIISFCSAALHFKSTAWALFFNTPQSTYYQPSFLHPLNKEHLSTVERGSTAVARIFGAIREHPAVAAVGWDVLLSGLSLGVWAAIRGLDVDDMLTSSTPFMKQGNKIREAKNSVKAEIESAVTKVEETPSTRRRPGRPKKTETTATPDDDSTVSVPRHRGRFAKKTNSKEDDEDDAYAPSGNNNIEEGDEVTDEDWEVGALAWGLIAAGGLGVGSASVYGAEVKAR